MIILPDRSISRSKFLVPVPKKEWVLPSDFTYRDDFGNLGIRTKFFITGRLDDGHKVWSTEFEDREDFDAFLYALHAGTLKTEKSLWKLPTNEWHDGLNEGIKYEFTTGIFYTIQGAGSFTVPTDWNSNQNVIYCIGGGGHGCATQTSTVNAKATGGGGGECRAIQNYSVAKGTVISTYVAYTTGNTSLSWGGTSSYSPGNDGQNTTFNVTTVVANGGKGGQGTTGTGTVAAVNGGSGGTGTYGSNGGDGGSVTAAGGASGGGGGAGVAFISSSTNATTVAGTSSATVSVSNSAGLGGQGAGGAGGVSSPGADGSNSYNNGGNGGNGNTMSNASGSGGDGGQYGAGGGGCAARSVSTNGTSTSGGNGKQGMISIVYTPGNLFGFGNPPVMGL